MSRRTLAVLVAAVTMAVLLVVTSGVGMAQATTQTFQVRNYESFIIPENSTCPGQEAIQVEGFFHHVLQLTVVDNPNTQSDTDIYKITNVSNTSDVVGTGLVSGNEYRFVNTGRFNETLLFPELTPQGTVYTGIEESSYAIIGSGASPNLRVYDMTKIVYAEDGAPSLTIQNATFSCTEGPPAAAATA